MFPFAYPMSQRAGAGADLLHTAVSTLLASYNAGTLDPALRTQLEQGLIQEILSDARYTLQGSGEAHNAVRAEVLTILRGLLQREDVRQELDATLCKKTNQLVSQDLDRVIVDELRKSLLGNLTALVQETINDEMRRRVAREKRAAKKAR